MLRETRGLEYALVIVRTLGDGRKRDSRTIASEVGNVDRTPISRSYTQKMLQRMVKTGLLTSSESGYALAKPLAEMTVADLLGLCDLPASTSPIYQLCKGILSASAALRIVELPTQPGPLDGSANAH